MVERIIEVQTEYCGLSGLELIQSDCFDTLGPVICWRYSTCQAVKKFRAKPPLPE